MVKALSNSMGLDPALVGLHSARWGSTACKIAVGIPIDLVCQVLHHKSAVLMEAYTMLIQAEAALITAQGAQVAPPPVVLPPNPTAPTCQLPAWMSSPS